MAEAVAFSENSQSSLRGQTPEDLGCFLKMPEDRTAEAAVHFDLRLDRQVDVPREDLAVMSGSRAWSERLN